MSQHTYDANYVYSTVQTAVSTAFPSAYTTSRYRITYPKYPCCFLREIDRYCPEGTVAFSGMQGIWNSTFEMQVISNDVQSGLSQCRAIMDVARNKFSELFYRETGEVVEDTGTSVRIIARFARIIGSGEVAYTTQSEVQNND